MERENIKINELEYLRTHHHLLANARRGDFLVKIDRIHSALLPILD